VAFLFLEGRKMMSESEVTIWLEEVESDSWIQMKSADPTIDPHLALAQMGLETTSDVLRRILCLPLCGHNPKTGRWEVKDKAAGQA
jgi:hypothetical protein